MDSKKTRFWFMRGIREAFGMPVLILSLSMLGVGGLAHDAQFPLTAAMLSTIFIWAAPAQVIMFGLIAGGASVATIALAIGVSSIRFLPMSMSLLPLIRQGDTKKSTLCAAAHYIAITNGVEGMRRLPALPKPARLSYFFGFGNTTLTLATLATGIGYFLASTLPPILAAGLLFLSPIYFSTAMLRSVQVRSDFYAIALGFTLMPLAVLCLPAGLDLLCVGFAGGTIAYYLGLRTRQKAALS